MPGIKDGLVVWTVDGKATLRKYYLTMIVQEAYKLYCNENPADSRTINILQSQTGLDNSYHCMGVPKTFGRHCRNVLLLKDIPSDQCKHCIHENFLCRYKLFTRVMIQSSGQLFCVMHPKLVNAGYHIVINAKNIHKAIKLKTFI